MMTIAETGAAIRSGERTPLDLVEECLSRITKFDRQVQAWVLVDDDGARETARQLGAEAAAGKLRGPLHGIPIAIKDIYDVQGYPTLAGSSIPPGTPATEDAPVVAKLRSAGAIFLGKTVTTELASFDPPPTRNPWNLNRTPGGSSSGSAAAAALGMCLGALGSQTGGSITRPATYCGIAGLKPSYGRVSLRGVFPLAYSMDHPGPLARTVADLAYLFQVIAGYDEHDPFSVAAPVPDYLTVMQGNNRPPRLGLVEGFFVEEAEEQVRRATQAALGKLRDAGATIVPVPPPADFREVFAMHRRIMAVEAAEIHRATFAQRRSEFGRQIAALIDEGLKLPAADYAEARRHQVVFHHRLRAAFAGIDALVTPATSTTAPGPETTGDPKFISPWSYSHLPTVSIPCGLADDGMPSGLQLIGRPFAEGPLLGVAAWCERQLAFTLVPPMVR